MFAPVNDDARRIVSEITGRECTAADVLEWQRGWNVECRDIPLKAAVLESLANEAREVVDRLATGGIAFAGRLEEAALVVCGTAYAAWRASMAESGGREPHEKFVLPIAGFWAGIEHARAYAAGIPQMYRAAYLSAIATSDDPLDKLPPLAVLMKIWPEDYGDWQAIGSGVTVDDDAACDQGDDVDEFLANSRNIMNSID